VQITNPKIGYAYYPGFSLLFDNPPGRASLKAAGGQGDFLRVHCDLACEPCKLYQLLAAGVEALARPGGPLGRFTLVKLPPRSYHVTAWDGLSASGTRRVSRSHARDVKDLLLRLPDSLKAGSPLTELARTSALCQAAWDLEFRFRKLYVSAKGGALIACLKCTDPSRRRYGPFKRQRARLYDAYAQQFGLKGARTRYDPHVSLAYFASLDEAAQAKRELKGPTCIKAMPGELKDATIRFTTISLYGFLNMATFLKPSCPDC